MARVDAGVENGNLDAITHANCGVPSSLCVDFINVPFAAQVRIVRQSTAKHYPVQLNHLQLWMTLEHLGNGIG